LSVKLQDQKIAAFGSSYRFGVRRHIAIGHNGFGVRRPIAAEHKSPVGAGEACDLLILIDR
jgi:hypothetical protein